MTDDLYRDILIEVGNSPSHQGNLADHDLVLPAFNVSCGDKLVFQVKLRNPELAEQSPITAIKWQGEGCLVSRASADLLASYALENQLTVSQLAEFSAEDVLELLGLETISPARQKCMLLGVSAFKAASFAE